MIDHLHRLAAHALDRLSSARPRLASRFEPIVAAPPTPVDPDDSVFAPQDRVPVMRAKSAPQATTDIAPQLTAIRPTELSLPTSPTWPAFERQTEETHRPITATVSPDRRAEEPLEKANPSARPVSPVPIRKSEDVVRTSLNEEPSRGAETIASPALHLYAAEPTITTRQGAVVATEMRNATSVRPPTDPRAVATLFAPLHGTDQPMAAGRAAKSSISTATPKSGPSTDLEEATPQDAPVVQVTIGRIEVRAAPTVERPTSAGKTASIMGLDEYLKRRGRGEGT